jgi:hypothetical protein
VKQSEIDTLLRIEQLLTDTRRAELMRHPPDDALGWGRALREELKPGLVVLQLPSFPFEADEELPRFTIAGGPYDQVCTSGEAQWIATMIKVAEQDEPISTGFLVPASREALCRATSAVWSLSGEALGQLDTLLGGPVWNRTLPVAEDTN